MKPALTTRLLSTAFFGVLAIAFLGWFIFSATDLVLEIGNNSPVVKFDMGAMYMLGGGIACLVFVTGGVYQGLLGKELSSNGESFFRNAIIGGIAIMFIFPYVAHNVVERAVKDGNYYSCETLSYQWLLYKKYVYTDTFDTCARLVREKEAEKSARRY